MPKTYPQRLLDFAKQYVPLLRTYLEREELRDVDKLIRDELVKKMQELIDKINDVKRELVDSGRLAGLDLLDRSTHKLEKLRDSIRFASRGYSGVFDLEQLNEQVLNRLIEFDQNLFEQINSLADKVKEVLSRPKSELKTTLRELDEEIDIFEEKLDQRDSYARKTSEEC